ncbi:MAG TPA: iron chelate uptake ABC transporter family permease subunit [Acholeplasmataceae bacterium]|nr:iron chelate uptake ABC transporter family permease subunit [Acholeplasmataceae bacterium]
MQKFSKLFSLLFIMAVTAFILYIFLWYFTGNQSITQSAFQSIVSRRLSHVIAMTVAAILIAVSSLSFQTITNNRLLTPSMLGFDAVFIATQTFLIFIFGTNSTFFSNPYYNFIISSFVMIFISLSLYSFILKKNKNQIFVLLLVGLVISTLISSITSFIQRIMNPDELDTVISASMVSIGNINTKIIYLAIPLMIILIGLFYKNRRYYDTMTLGDDNAINLGVDYHKKTKETMIYIAFSMAIATALIGPITFLGLLTVNLAREIFKTYRHSVIMLGSSLIAIITLVLGQLIIEQLKIGVPVTVLINLIGGAYMIYLIWRMKPSD